MLRLLILSLVLASSLVGAATAPGAGVPESASASPQAAFEETMRRARTGDVPAQYRLAQLYSEGLGTAQDNDRAMHWYRMAAGQGHPEAQFTVGVLLATGKGIPQDDKQAVDWYLRAAKQGHVDAQYNLGYMYANGRGIERDTERARIWYQMAAGQDHVRAQINLGALYASGDGVKRDEKRAAEWYRKAADAGDADAQYSLAYLYTYGRGVPRDQTKALHWYERAAAQGHEQARARSDALRGRLEKRERRIRVEMGNLRDGPGLDSAILARLPQGQVVYAVGSNGDWIEVDVPGKNTPGGWLHRSLLDGEPERAPEPVAKPLAPSQVASYPAPGKTTGLAQVSPLPNEAVPSPLSTRTAKPLVDPNAVRDEEPIVSTPPAASGTPPEPATASEEAPASATRAPQSTAPGSGVSKTAVLSARVDEAHSTLRDSLDERDELLTRLSSITSQTATLTEQIRAMESQRAELKSAVARRLGKPDPLPTMPVAPEPPAVPVPVTRAATPPADSLRGGLEALLGRLDTRLATFDERLARLEGGQRNLQRQSLDTREALLDLRSRVDEKLVEERARGVAAQAAEIETNLKLNALRDELSTTRSHNQSLDDRNQALDERNRALDQALITRQREQDVMRERITMLADEREALLGDLGAALQQLDAFHEQAEPEPPQPVENTGSMASGGATTDLPTALSSADQAESATPAVATQETPQPDAGNSDVAPASAPVTQ